MGENNKDDGDDASGLVVPGEAACCRTDGNDDVALCLIGAGAVKDVTHDVDENAFESVMMIRGNTRRDGSLVLLLGLLWASVCND